MTQSDLDSQRENEEDSSDDDESNYDHEASDDTDDESDSDIIFYMNLLMNLSPSMEQVYSQAMKEEEDTTSVGSWNTHVPHMAQSYEVSIGTDTEKVQDQSLGIGPPTLTDKAFCKSLRERFTEMMQKRSKRQDKKLWPKIPIPPKGAPQVNFQKQLHALSKVPLNYENSAILDEALSVVPLDNIYREAEEENLLKEAQALSLGSGVRPQLGYQDCVIRALLRYALVFRNIARYEA